MTGYARVTGRVLGPEGLGRMGTVEFFPAQSYQAVEEDGVRSSVVHYAAGRLRPDGFLVNARDEKFLKVVAPAALAPGEKNYRVVIDIPGDLGWRREFGAHLVAGISVDLTDIIRGVEVSDLTPPPSGSPLVRESQDGDLEAVNSPDVVDIGGGILTWRDGLG